MRGTWIRPPTGEDSTACTPPLQRPTHLGALPGGLVGENPPASAEDSGDAGSIPELGQSAGGGNGNPLQDSCLENPMDRGAWQAIIHGVAKNQTQQMRPRDAEPGCKFCPTPNLVLFLHSHCLMLASLDPRSMWL